MTATLPPPSPVECPPAEAGSGRVRLLLASKSPRRLELLLGASIPHGTIESHIDDGQLAPGETPPFAWVAALSYLKARAAWERLPASGRRGVIVLGADTVVRKGSEIIGQPRDRADAERILRNLENGAHEVLTGVTLLSESLPARALAGLGMIVEPEPDSSGARRAALVDTARVRVGAIGAERIARYLDSEHWRGKAGAYNLSERVGDGWPITYEGDPGTIMGLPMVRLAPALRLLLEGGSP